MSSRWSRGITRSASGIVYKLATIRGYKENVFKVEYTDANWNWFSFQKLIEIEIYLKKKITDSWYA